MSENVYRVCAIAKDEAPYLAEWVFHHHYFGFQSIVVYVNRTTDTSIKVLERLQQYIPGLEYEIVDWLDYCGPEVGSKIQTISYAKDIDKCKELSVDYWLPLDIDEFWTPADFKTNINEHVSAVTDGSSAVSFPWYCEIGHIEPFSMFSPRTRFHFGSHVKTLSPKPWESIRRVRIHLPVYNKLAVVNPSGNKVFFQKDRPQLLEKSSLAKQPAYIVHRMNRSELEYFAMLKKGQPKSKNSLKMNRSGYKGYSNPSRREFSWPITEYTKYMDDRRVFLEDANIEEIVSEDKENILLNAKFVIERLKLMLTEGPEASAVATKLLSGTTYANS